MAGVQHLLPKTAHDRIFRGCRSRVRRLLELRNRLRPLARHRIPSEALHHFPQQRKRVEIEVRPHSRVRHAEVSFRHRLLGNCHAGGHVDHRGGERFHHLEERNTLKTLRAVLPEGLAPAVLEVVLRQFAEALRVELTKRNIGRLVAERLPELRNPKIEQEAVTLELDVQPRLWETGLAGRRLLDKLLGLLRGEYKRGRGPPVGMKLVVALSGWSEVTC